MLLFSARGWLTSVLRTSEILEEEMTYTAEIELINKMTFAGVSAIDPCRHGTVLFVGARRAEFLSATGLFPSIHVFHRLCIESS